MMLETPQVKDALARLSPSTHWTDVVGNADPTTKWPDHMATARERNPLEPASVGLHPQDAPDSTETTREHYDRQHNSDVMILTDRAHAHMDMSEEHALMAEFAARALERQDNHEGTARRSQ
jgi:hypothetical protein